VPTVAGRPYQRGQPQRQLRRARPSAAHGNSCAHVDDVAMNVLVDPAQAEFCDRLFADGFQ
jgi:hypothetical protein